MLTHRFGKQFIAIGRASEFREYNNRQNKLDLMAFIGILVLNHTIVEAEYTTTEINHIQYLVYRGH